MYERAKAEQIASSFVKDFQDFGVSLSETYHSPRFETVIKDWLIVKKEGHIPTRSELDPLRYPKIMPYMGLYEPVTGEKDWRFRICGTAMVRVFNTDATGKRMFGDGVIEDNIRPAFTRYFDLVYNWPHPIWFNGTVWYWQDKHHISYEGLSLPLSKDGHTISQNLQIFHYFSGDELH